MKIYFYISVAASALSLVLSIVLFGVGNSNQSLQNDAQKQQTELQKQQEEINKAQEIQGKLGPNLLQDMAKVSLKDENMKKLLAKNGYNVQLPPASPAPGAATPAPARAPSPSSTDPLGLHP
jgi:hypothetical protein